MKRKPLSGGAILLVLILISLAVVHLWNNRTMAKRIREDETQIGS